MKKITFTLTEQQAQTLAGLISLGVSALGAQISQAGAAGLKEGARMLVESDGVVDVINAAINEVMQKEQANKKDRKNRDED